MTTWRFKQNLNSWGYRYEGKLRGNLNSYWIAASPRSDRDGQSFARISEVSVIVSEIQYTQQAIDTATKQRRKIRYYDTETA